MVSELKRLLSRSELTVSAKAHHFLEISTKTNRYRAEIEKGNQEVPSSDVFCVSPSDWPTYYEERLWNGHVSVNI